MFPWLLAAVADPRRLEADARDIGRRFLDTDDRQLDEHFGLELRDRLSGIGDLFSQRWKKALYLWAWEVLTTPACAEFQHGRNAQRCHEKEAWAICCAKAFNGEAMIRMEQQHAFRAKQHRPVARGSDVAIQPSVKRFSTLASCSKNDAGK